MHGLCSTCLQVVLDSRAEQRRRPSVESEWTNPPVGTTTIAGKQKHAHNRRGYATRVLSYSPDVYRRVSHTAGAHVADDHTMGYPATAHNDGCSARGELRACLQFHSLNTGLPRRRSVVLRECCLERPPPAFFPQPYRGHHRKLSPLGFLCLR